MKPTFRRQFLPSAIILTILLLAFALRLYALDAQSLWYDEAVTAQVASRGIAELTRWTADDIQPPLYYYVVAGWTRLVGRSEWALRFPSAFFGVLTVALLWAVARRLFEKSTVWNRGFSRSVSQREKPAEALTPAQQKAFLRAHAHVAPRATTDAHVAEHPERSRVGPRRSRRIRSGRPGMAASFDFTARPFDSAALSSGDALLRSGCLLVSRTVPDHLAAGTAALLAAVLPLYVYYAQEARMYTLLTFLGVLAGYALLRAWGQGSRGAGEQGWWIAFVLAAAAMLYTHYFGVFLLIAYAICFLAAWLLRLRSSAFVRARPRHLLRFGIAALGILLLYLPWLPAMLNRYRVDVSYWQGALKLGEALRHVALSFTVAAPEMMLEPEGIRLLPFFGVTLFVGIVALLWRRQAGVTLTLLTVLIVPLLAVLLLASRTPKFNPRYLMLATPAYLLVLAGGITALWRIANSAPVDGRGDTETQRYGPHTAHCVLRTTLALLLTILLITTSLVSLRNWFTDPAFTKSQWRELTAFVRRERRSDEAVLLVSGHAYPAWDYYAADVPAVRLPPIDILDVNALLGFAAGADLAAALSGQAGAWLVTWQDEVVDPVGFVPYFLNRAGAEQPVPASFWHVGLRHWRLRSNATYSTEPQPQHVQAANFDHKLALLGWDAPDAGQITVYWRVLNTLLQDYQVSVGVETASGAQVGHWDGRPAGYDYPTTRWQPGQTLFGRYPLALPAGAAPGDYIVTLTIYDAADPAGLDIRDEADNPAGKRVRLGPVRVD